MLALIRAVWRKLYPSATGFCRDCGKIVIEGETYCPPCWAKNW